MSVFPVGPMPRLATAFIEPLPRPQRDRSTLGDAVRLLLSEWRRHRKGALQTRPRCD